MNDDKIKHLQDISKEPDKDIIIELENALEMAKNGHIRSIAIAASLTNNKTLTTYVSYDLQESIGLVSFLHHTLCAKQRETALE